MLPRSLIAVVIVALGAAAALVACRFDADYDGADLRCSDGVCPSGLTCRAGRCVDPDAVDAIADDATASDAPLADLTCGDPGLLPRGESIHAGDTTGTNHVSGQCGGIFNGPDHVYRLAANAGDSVTLTVDGDIGARVYAVTACVPPNIDTPDCLGGDAAFPGAPVTLAIASAGDVFVLVDGDNAALGVAYELTVDVAP